MTTINPTTDEMAHFDKSLELVLYGKRDEEAIRTVIERMGRIRFAQPQTS